jgi:hypothetical protein
VGKLRKVFGGIWAVFWAAILVAATVPAKTAVTNLASWADFTGTSWLVHLAATKGADHFAQVLSIVALLILAIVPAASFFVYGKLEVDGKTRNGLFYRFTRGGPGSK